MGKGVAMPKKYFTHMSVEERETLSLGLAQGHSLRTMVTVLGRVPSTISRESTRNTMKGHPYRACTAHMLATVRRRQPRRPRKLLDPWLWRYVQTHLTRGCSPEQIAGRLRREYPDDMRKRLSAETIYAALYILSRGSLRSELLAALRQARKARRPRARRTDRRGQIPNMTLIAGRPAEVAIRPVPGHWEEDLIKGARNGSAVGSLVEGTTRLVILARLDGTDAGSAREGFTRKLKHVPVPLRKTLTYERGKEMPEHERLGPAACHSGVSLPIRIVPGNGGTNENTKGLLRQYLLKGTDLSGYTQRQLNAIAHRLNTRPRKCLDWAMPLEVFTQLRHQSPVALGT